MVVYSSAFLADGGCGSLSLFTVPKGQQIPDLSAGRGTVVLPPYLQVYTDATTSMVQAGQLGNAIGDFTAESMGIHIHKAIPEIFNETTTREFLIERPWRILPKWFERANSIISNAMEKAIGLDKKSEPRTVYRPLVGVTDYGATPSDVDQIRQTVSFELRVSSKSKIKAPLKSLCDSAEIWGMGAETLKLPVPFEIGRQEFLEGVLNVCGPGQALRFTPTRSGAPRVVLITVALYGTAKQDIR